MNRIQKVIISFLIMWVLELVQDNILMWSRGKTSSEEETQNGSRESEPTWVSQKYLEPPVLEPMSFPFNISIKVITQRSLYKTCAIVVENLTVRLSEMKWAMFTFGVIKIQ